MAERPEPERYLEIETKLEIDPDSSLPDLSRNAGLAAAGMARVTDPVEHQLDAVYFDTDHLDLLRSHVTLRRRTGGDDAGWHLKLPATRRSEGQPPGRTEVRMPSGTESDGVPAELAELILGTARGRRLAPVARLQNRRVIQHLLDERGRPLVEVADDHVTATTLTDDPKEPVRWRELEAEILQGTADHLAAAVQALLAAGARPSSSASKLGRALAVSPIVVPGRPTSAGAVVIAAVIRARDQLIVADRGLREAAATALHSALVASSRLDSLLAIFAPVLPDAPARRIRTVLHDLDAGLRSARDLQVVGELISARLRDEPEEFAGVTTDRMHTMLDAKSSAARLHIVELIDSEPYLTMLRDLDDLIADPGQSQAAEKPAAPALSELTAQAWARLGALADRALADPADSAAAREVLSAATVLGDAMDQVQQALGGDPAMVTATRELQHVLQEHHHSVVAAAVLVELATDPATDESGAVVFGRLHAVEQGITQSCVEGFADAWRRIRDRSLPADH